MLWRISCSSLSTVVEMADERRNSHAHINNDSAIVSKYAGVPEQGLRLFDFNGQPSSQAFPRKTLQGTTNNHTQKPGKQGSPISISGCTLVGPAFPQAPPNAGSPASHLLVPDDEKDSRNASMIISVHIQIIKTTCFPTAQECHHKAKAAACRNARRRRRRPLRRH